jgi:hypothetical protein
MPHSVDGKVNDIGKSSLGLRLSSAPVIVTRSILTTLSITQQGIIARADGGYCRLQ